MVIIAFYFYCAHAYRPRAEYSWFESPWVTNFSFKNIFNHWLIRSKFMNILKLLFTECEMAIL